MMKRPYPMLPGSPVRLVLLVLFVLALVSSPLQGDEPGWLAPLLEQETLTIVVTDSGLGGLSVVADAAEEFKTHKPFKAVNLVFFNALFSDAAGYNGLQTREEKLAVFNSALWSMQQRYRPDLVLVACNTLSVLVPDTDFAQRSPVPVVGIVESGVEQIARGLRADPEARNILFATQTTVDEGTHRSLLLETGIADEQLVTQSCPQLTMYIEQGFDAMDTEMLIDAYVDEALTQAGDITGPLTVSFNCTHFGYSLAAWQLAFESRGIDVTAYLDPNNQMTDFLLPESLHDRFDEVTVSVEAVSMIEIPQASLDSIGRYLGTVSPATESALRRYQLVPDLFEWRSLAGSESP